MCYAYFVRQHQPDYDSMSSIPKMTEKHPLKTFANIDDKLFNEGIQIS